MTAEAALVEAAKRYLKQTYDEDTLAMTVTQNTVREGNGVLAVECTVSWNGTRSDWTKQFTFKAGQVASMRAQPK